MKKVEAIFRPERLGVIQEALEGAGFSGFTIADVRGHGTSPETRGEYRGQTYELSVSHKLYIEIIVEDDEVKGVVEVIIKGARTGKVGDGLVTVSEISEVYQIRAGFPSAGAVQEEVSLTE